MASGMEMASGSRQLGIMMAVGMTTIRADTGSRSGLTVVFLKVSSREACFMATVAWSGTQRKARWSTKVSMLMTQNMAADVSSGPTVEFTTVSGCEESVAAKAYM